MAVQKSERMFALPVSAKMRTEVRATKRTEVRATFVPLRRFHQIIINSKRPGGTG